MGLKKGAEGCKDVGVCTHFECMTLPSCQESQHSTHCCQAVHQPVHLLTLGPVGTHQHSTAQHSTAQHSSVTAPFNCVVGTAPDFR
jgi:hypothetical protein